MAVSNQQSLALNSALAKVTLQLRKPDFTPTLHSDLNLPGATPPATVEIDTEGPNAEAERLAALEAEREAREKTEREAREKTEREAREKTEREAREKTEREAKEKALRLSGSDLGDGDGLGSRRSSVAPSVSPRSSFVSPESRRSSVAPSVSPRSSFVSPASRRTSITGNGDGSEPVEEGHEEEPSAASNTGVTVTEIAEGTVQANSKEYKKEFESYTFDNRLSSDKLKSDKWKIILTDKNGDSNGKTRKFVSDDYPGEKIGFLTGPLTITKNTVGGSRRTLKRRGGAAKRISKNRFISKRLHMRRTRKLNRRHTRKN